MGTASPHHRIVRLTPVTLRHSAPPIGFTAQLKFSLSALNIKYKRRNGCPPRGCSCSECPYSTWPRGPFLPCSSARGTCTSQNWTSPVHSATACTGRPALVDDAADPNDSRTRRWRHSVVCCGRGDRSTESLPVLPAACRPPATHDTFHNSHSHDATKWMVSYAVRNRARHQTVRRFDIF